MSLRLLVSTLVISMNACGPSPSGPAPGTGRSTLALEAGTSFGMGAGYCTTRLVVDGARAVLVESARGGRGSAGDSLPDRTRSVELSPAEQARFRAALDTAALARLAGVHGCPDCADGGAEWIVLGRTRVTFEFGKELASIAPLQREIRALRARFR